MTMRLYECQALSLLSNRLEPRVIGDVQVLGVVVGDLDKKVGRCRNRMLSGHCGSRRWTSSFELREPSPRLMGSTDAWPRHCQREQRQPGR
jgi:hypothetical protein